MAGWDDPAARIRELEAEVHRLQATIDRARDVEQTWMAVHGDAGNDLESLGLYGVAYRECAGDLRTALDA